MHFDAVEQRHRVLAAQPAVERAAEAAEARVAAIAESQQRIVQRGETTGRAGIAGGAMTRIRVGFRHHAREEARGAVGRIALAGRADDEQRARRRGQHAGIDGTERDDLGGDATRTERFGTAPGELFGEAGLARMRDQHRRRARDTGGAQPAGTALHGSTSAPVMPRDREAQGHPGETDQRGRDDAHGLAHAAVSRASWRARD